ncbi:MAG: PAS domain S-box protein, partial [Pseudomonadota bacterium]
MINTSSHTILIVDSNPVQAEALQQTLTEKGYRVLIASNGTVALNIMRRSKPSLVVSEAMTPLMDGYALCAEIKKDQSLKHIPVILLIEFSDISGVIRALLAKADNYISKPHRPDFLLHSIESILSASPESGEQFRIELTDFTYNGKSFLLPSSPKQMFNFLFSCLENAVHQRTELIEAQNRLSKIDEEREQWLIALKKSEHRFNILVQMLPDIVYRLDTEGRFIFVNDAVNMIGYKPEELIGKHFKEIIVPEDFECVSRDHVLPYYWGKITGPENSPKLFDERRTGSRMTRNLEVRLERSSSTGNINDLHGNVAINGIFAQVNSSGMYDVEKEGNKGKPSGDYLGTVGTITDITDRKLAQAALLRSEEQFRMLVQTAASVIILISPGGTILEWNSEAEAVFGHKKNTIVGKDFWGLFEEDQKGLLRAAALDTLVGKAVRDIETRIVNLEGKTRSVLWNMSSLLNHESEPIAVIAVGQDVTEWKKAEEEKAKALGEAEIMRITAETAMETIDGMQDSVLITTPEGIITQINQGFRTTLGWGDETIGQNIAVYVTEGLGDLQKTFGDLSPSKPHQENVSCSLLTKDGTSVPSLANLTFVDASQKGSA